MRIISGILISLSFVSSNAQSTTPVLIDSTASRKNLTKHDLPAISPATKSFRVFGEYNVQIIVDATGRVTSATALSGPPALEFDALRYAQTLTYKPFTVDGQPVTATTVVSVSFGPASPLFSDPNPWPMKAHQDQAQCLTATIMTKSIPEAAKHCEDVADDVDKLPMNGNFMARRATYVEASGDLLRNKQFKEALVEANKAVAVVELGHDDGDGSCSAYLIRAEAEAVLNQLAASSLDLTKAENAERLAMDIIQSDSLKKQYAAMLKNVLTYHAKVLTASGDAPAANAKRDEAAKL